tara:strand:- start:1607 stop:1771 length:165 start_codon:yes stop_codon:yes gene_type:complete
MPELTPEQEEQLKRLTDRVVFKRKLEVILDEIEQASDRLKILHKAMQKILDTQP